MLLFLSLTFCILRFIGFSTSTKPPNVVFIWFDDLGFSEPGFNGGMFNTPILDDIAANSIKLNQHYTELICSASRSALLTGRYSWTTGLNYLSNPFTNPRVNENLSLLPELLKGKNYSTHITGKYHLGYRYWNDIPFNRGFDEGLVNHVGSSFYSRIRCRPFSYFDGFYTNVPDSLKTTRNGKLSHKYGSKFCGDNLYDENNAHPFTTNTDYIERILTDDIKTFIGANSATNSAPFFVYNSAKTPHGTWVDPPALTGLNYNTLCGHITAADGQYRSKLCKMVQYEEHMIKEIIDKLKAEDIYNDTVVIITTDNGGAAGVGRNLPLRGTKGGVYEGGIRTMALITGGYVDNNILSPNAITSCEYNGLFHVSDWYHTILSIAGLTDSNADDDHKNIDQWQLIQKHCNSSSVANVTERDEIIYMRMCEDASETPNRTFYSTFIRKNAWKLVINGSITDVLDCPRANVNQIIMESGYAKTDATFTTIPNEIEYNAQYNNVTRRPLYNSDCYNGLTSAQKSNASKFAYSEFMLFNISSDKIEACNVAAQYPQIVQDLFNIIKARAADYDSRNDREPKPKGGAVMAQIDTYDCATETMSLVPWDDRAEWNYNVVWQHYIDKVDACSFTVSMDGEGEMASMPYIITCTLVAVVLLISIAIIFWCIRKKKKAMSIKNVEMTAKESGDMEMPAPGSIKVTNAQSEIVSDTDENAVSSDN